MAVINNEDILHTFHYLSTLDNILKKEIRMVNGNKSYIDKIVPENLVKVYSQKGTVASEFVDNLSRTSYEASLITLVASFERIIFAKYKTAYGTIKSYVGELEIRPLDYFRSKERFVNGSIDKLHAIIDLIEGHVEDQLFQKLKGIKEHRDYIAHGKRFGKPPAFELTIEEIAVVLDNIILEIEKN